MEFAAGLTFDTLSALANGAKQLMDSGYLFYRSIRYTPVVDVTQNVAQRGLNTYWINKTRSDTKGLVDKLRTLNSSDKPRVVQETVEARSNDMIAANAISYVDAIRLVRHAEPLRHLVPAADLIADVSSVASAVLMTRATLREFDAARVLETSPEQAAWEKKKRMMRLVKYSTAAAFVLTTLAASYIAPEGRVQTASHYLRNSYYTTATVYGLAVTWEHRKTISAVANTVLQKAADVSSYVLSPISRGFQWLRGR